MQLLHLNVVLAAIDRDDSSVDALRGADALAKAAGAKLHVVHVARSDVPAEQGIERLLARAAVSPGAATLHLLVGEPAHAIRSLGDRVGADVIALGRHRGLPSQGNEIGSTALAVVTNSWAPCLILSGEMTLPITRVLVPVDLSDVSRGALVVALSWASALRAGKRTKGDGTCSDVVLTALLVERAPADGGAGARQVHALENELDHLRHDAGTWANVAIRGLAVSGRDIAATIADFARDDRSELVVLGTRGIGAAPVGRLGSVSLGVAQQLRTPILLVPPARSQPLRTTG